MGDAGFFRGTSAEQDNRFADKQKKLLKTLKFEDSLTQKVDMKKVNLDVLKPWITARVNDYLSFEDDVLVEFIFSQLEDKSIDPRSMQINLTGFLNAKKAREFMGELWTLLLTAQDSPDGIPPQMLEAKKEELKKKMAEEEELKASAAIALDSARASATADEKRMSDNNRANDRRRNDSPRRSPYRRRFDNSPSYSRRRGQSPPRVQRNDYSRDRPRDDRRDQHRDDQRDRYRDDQRVRRRDDDVDRSQRRDDDVRGRRREVVRSDNERPTIKNKEESTAPASKTHSHRMNVRKRTSSGSSRSSSSSERGKTSDVKKRPAVDPKIIPQKKSSVDRYEPKEKLTSPSTNRRREVVRSDNERPTIKNKEESTATVSKTHSRRVNVRKRSSSASNRSSSSSFEKEKISEVKKRPAVDPKIVPQIKSPVDREEPKEKLTPPSIKSEKKKKKKDKEKKRKHKKQKKDKKSKRAKLDDDDDNDEDINGHDKRNKKVDRLDDLESVLRKKALLSMKKNS